MAFDIFAFFAIVFVVLAITTGVGLIVYNVKKNTLQVGDLVRTTFTACPTVLTTALFGVNGEYATTNSYGFNFDEDAANALHCDMPKGKGTFSTWVSDGGQNFKSIPWATNSQLYVLQNTCTQNSDCETLTIPCGPDYAFDAPGFNPTARAVTHEAGVIVWDTTSKTPYSFQCPANSYCSVCRGDATVDPYCPNASGVGKCIVNNPTQVFSCTQPYASVSEFYCGVTLPVGPDSPPIQRQFSCSVNNNYASVSYQLSGFPSVTCGSVTEVPKPFFCNFEGNPACLVGQQCVTNTSANSGWCPTPGGESCGGSLSFAAFVCSGTVYPSVAIKSQWIAEGFVASISSTGRLSIQWNRVQNTYPGIGPSLGQCNTGTSNCSASLREEDFDNQSWVYSDCRFVVQDSVTTASRHASVSLALLGTSVSNPLGLGIFSSTDASFSSFNLQNLLFVSVSSSGSIQNNWSSTAATPYRSSAWNLQSVGVPQTNVEKIFFYSIHPFVANEDTLQWHGLNYA